MAYCGYFEPKNKSLAPSEAKIALLEIVGNGRGPKSGPPIELGFELFFGDIMDPICQVGEGIELF